MDGIHILNTYEMIDKTPYWIAWIIALGLFAIVTIICFIINAVSEYKHDFEFADASASFTISCLVATVALFAGMSMIFGINTDIDNKYTVYEILPDDAITANELIDKYDIIETKGDIFVVKDKIEVTK